MTPPIALTIAGSDPSGGAGIQADLKTFHQHGVYGTSVLTLLTVQNTVGVEAVEILAPTFAVAQLHAVTEDLPPQAAKTGALGSPEMVEAIAFEAASFLFPLVVDPVMISKHGAPLLSPAAAAAVKQLLLPAATLLTPNLPEAAALTGLPVDTIPQMHAAAQALLDLGPAAVLLKGGHLPGGESLDLLATSQGIHELPAPRIDTRHTHGTGCSYSAAITAHLAHGLPLLAAVERAKAWIHRAIATNPGLGRGQGPVNHFAAP